MSRIKRNLWMIDTEVTHCVTVRSGSHCRHPSLASQPPDNHGQSSPGSSSSVCRSCPPGVDDSFVCIEFRPSEDATRWLFMRSGCLNPSAVHSSFDSFSRGHILGRENELAERVNWECDTSDPNIACDPRPTPMAVSVSQRSQRIAGPRPDGLFARLESWTTRYSPPGSRPSVVVNRRARSVGGQFRDSTTRLHGTPSFSRHDILPHRGTGKTRGDWAERHPSPIF